MLHFDKTLTLRLLILGGGGGQTKVTSHDKGGRGGKTKNDFCDKGGVETLPNLHDVIYV